MSFPRVAALKALLAEEEKKTKHGRAPDPSALPGGVSGAFQDALLHYPDQIPQESLAALEKFLAGEGPRPELAIQ